MTHPFVAATSFTQGRQGQAINLIVIHWWGDPATNPTFDGTVAYFANGGNKTSAHYVVEAGRITQMVKDSDTAYQAGNWGVNLRSIGIECNPRASDADKAMVGQLVQELRSIHGNIPMVGHRDIVSTDCPGSYYPPNTALAPWLTSNTPTVKDNEMFLPIFMASVGEVGPDGKPWTPVYLLVPGKTPYHVSAQEFGYWQRLGAAMPTDRFLKAEIDIVAASMHPDPTAITIDPAMFAAAIPTNLADTIVSEIETMHLTK